MPKRINPFTEIECDELLISLGFRPCTPEESERFRPFLHPENVAGHTLEEQDHLDRLLLDAPGGRTDINSNLATKLDPQGFYGLRFALREIALHIVSSSTLRPKLQNPELRPGLSKKLQKLAKKVTPKFLALDGTQGRKLPPLEKKVDQFHRAVALVLSLIDGRKFSAWLGDLATRIDKMTLPEGFDPLADSAANNPSQHLHASYVEFYLRPAIIEAIAKNGKATGLAVAKILERMAARDGRSWKLPSPTQSQHSKKRTSLDGPTPRERVVKRLEQNIAAVLGGSK